jgi:hypothetical protein
VVLDALISKQNLSAETLAHRYNAGFSHAEQQAATDFQSNSKFNPVCVKHTSYYCAGYLKGYNATWNNLGPKRSNPTPNPPSHNSTSPPTSNINTTTANPPTVISSSTESRVVPFIIFVIVVLIIAAIARKLKHRRGKYKERQHFSDSIKEKVLERQHHRCADCKGF